MFPQMHNNTHSCAVAIFKYLGSQCLLTSILQSTKVSVDCDPSIFKYRVSQMSLLTPILKFTKMKVYCYPSIFKYRVSRGVS